MSSARAVSTRDVVRGTYRQMTFLGALFGLRRKPSQTPLEYARTVTDQLTSTIENDRTLAALRRAPLPEPVITGLAGVLQPKCHG